MTIEEYLAELERLLPRVGRTRFLAEAEGHLHDATRANQLRGLDAEAAEQAAVESFGEPALVARRLASVSGLSSVRWASALTLAASVALVLPLYGIPENTLPPARWETKPTEIAVLQATTIALWVTAIALAAAAFCLALVRQASAAAAVLLAATGAVGGLFVFGVVLFFVWLDEAPWTPLWPFVGLALPVAAICLGACVVASAWARDRSRRLSGRLVQD